MKTLKEFVQSDETLLVAHRGSSGTAPENTMAAFREAIDAGANMIETDIQFTSDDQVIIFHDADIDRTTDGKGLAGEYTYENLKKYDAGSWFDERFSGEKVPLLQDLIDLVKGNIYLNIEIKSRKSSVIDYRVEKILNTIIDNGLEEYTLFSSFDYGLLRKIKDLKPELHVAAIKIPMDPRSPSSICEKTGAEAFVCSLKQINTKMADDAEKAGIYLGVYSVDNSKQLDYLLQFNVRAIVSNYPALINQELRKRDKNR